MTARNRTAYARSQALREEIRQALLDHPRLAPPLTAKALQPLLSHHLSLRAIRWHLHAIRGHHGNSSSDTVLA